MDKELVIEFQNSHKLMLATLIGRRVPMEITIKVEGHDEPPKETQEMYEHLMNLINGPDLPWLFEFARIKAQDMSDKYHPAAATDFELRYAHCFLLFPTDLAKAIIKFVASMDFFRAKRMEWLAKNQKKEETRPSSKQQQAP